MRDAMNQPNQPPVFAYPRLSKTDLLFVRIGGNGLGNLMFTWARCLAAAQRQKPREAPGESESHHPGEPYVPPRDRLRVSE